MRLLFERDVRGRLDINLTAGHTYFVYAYSESEFAIAVKYVDTSGEIATILSAAYSADKDLGFSIECCSDMFTILGTVSPGTSSHSKTTGREFFIPSDCDMVRLESESSVTYKVYTDDNC